MTFTTTPHAVYYGTPEQHLGMITFPETAPGVFCIDHTEVDPSLKGQGIGAQLVEKAVASIRGQGGKVTATCSYARAWLDKHPDA